MMEATPGAEDGSLSGSALIWTIATITAPVTILDTQVEIQIVFLNLAPSTFYTITLTVTDSGGLTDVDTAFAVLTTS